MVGRRSFWMITVGNWKPPLNLPKFSSTERGNEKASPPNRWLSTQGSRASLSSSHAPRDVSILTILPQTNPGDRRSGEVMIEAALLGSGRPIMVVPYLQEGGVKFDMILVCWDGSHNAARAIADAMPFLTRAKLVEVVTVAAGGTADDSMAGLYIAHHLSRHDVTVELRDIVAHHQDVSLRIVSHAAQQSASLIVMGGYGHSRLREFVLGGATRDMLDSTTVPILMSH
ncbi:nucleotide-binding universal stress UspA family protein [Bradyrhizobium sp. LM3.6]